MIADIPACICTSEFTGAMCQVGTPNFNRPTEKYSMNHTIWPMPCMIWVGVEILQFIYMAGCKKMVEFRDVSLISQRKHEKQQSIIQFLLGRIYTKKSIYEIV